MQSDELKALVGPNMTQAHAFVSNLLKKHYVGKRFMEPVMSALISHHPTNHGTGKILGFIKHCRPPYNTPCLYTILETKSGGERLVDISWVKCVRNLYGKHDKTADKHKMTLLAFRNEAFEGQAMQDARAKYNVGPCGECGKMCKLAIDHAGKPFSQIMDEYLALNPKVPTTRFMGGTRVFYDRKLAQRWVGFHDQECELVGLCRSCNSSKGSGGYRHKSGF